MRVDEALPPLRALNIAPFRDERGQPGVILRDSSRIAPRPVGLSIPGYFLLTRFDGRSTCGDAQRAFAEQFGAQVAADDIGRLARTLDEALMLDNERFARVYAERREQYACAAARDNRAHWPDGAALRAGIERVLQHGAPADGAGLCAIIAPHLDYGRGAPCYADAYATLFALAPAERYVILGVNHFGRGAAVVATTKDFVTPLGRAKTDRAFIAALERELGQPLCGHELDHQAEHSVELQTHILQARLRRPFEIVPILCPNPVGPTRLGPHDGQGVDLGDFADALGAVTQRDGRRTVLISSSDLSHVGQHFGDEAPTTAAFLEQVRASDRALLRRVEAGAIEAFIDDVAATDNRTRICSVGNIYATTRALGGAGCEILRYHQAVNMEAETHVTCAAGVFRR